MPTFEYPVRVLWTGGREGGGTAKAQESGIEVPIAVPAEFQGPGGGSNPEELLTTAVGSCYAMTLGIVAANRKLPVKQIDVHVVGNVEKVGAGFEFSAVTIKPRVTLSADASDDQLAMAQDVAMKADHYCLITNAIRGKVAVAVEPTIVRE